MVVLQLHNDSWTEKKEGRGRQKGGPSITL